LGLIHWPPLFHFVEGVFFFLFGDSAIVARLLVVIFALLGLIYWFKIVCELQNEWAAAVSATLLAFLPSVLLYEKSVMLEIPALALCIAASFYWVHYLKTDEPGAVYRFAALAALALLTKQHSIYLAVFCLLTILYERKWRLLLTKQLLRALGLCVLIVGPFYTLAFTMHARTIANTLFQSPSQGNPYTFYPFSLPKQLGLIVLILALFGILTQRWWAKQRGASLMGMWILACYLTFTFIALKEPRYILYWLPPFLYFAVGPLTTIELPGRVRPLAALAMIGIVTTQAWSAWTFQRPYISGYAVLAHRMMEAGDPGIVLLDAEMAGNFIFYVRTLDPEKRCIVLRKALYATRIWKQYASEELLHSRGELESMLASYGIKYIVVDNGPVDFPIQNTLRELLRGGQFRLVATIPIESNILAWRGRALFLYENNKAEPVSVSVLRLRMMTLNNDIALPMNDLEVR
jgi:hypothetical protein